MAKQKYKLNANEKMVYKATNVRHGFWSMYTDTLIITNQSVILEKYGMLNNFKGIERFDYALMNQAILGKASNGEKQLELYMGDVLEDFALQSSDENELKILIMAINDQMGPDKEYYDINYCQNILSEAKENDRIAELRAKAEDDDLIIGESSLEFASTSEAAIAHSFF